MLVQSAFHQLSTRRAKGHVTGCGVRQTLHSQLESSAPPWREQPHICKAWTSPLRSQGSRSQDQPRCARPTISHHDRLRSSRSIGRMRTQLHSGPYQHTPPTPNSSFPPSSRKSAPRGGGCQGCCSKGVVSTQARTRALRYPGADLCL